MANAEHSAYFNSKVIARLGWFLVAVEFRRWLRVPMTIPELTPFQDHEVVLQFGDGETLRARILYADSEYEDIIIELVATSHTERYKDRTDAYTVSASEILFVGLSN
jgi:hypothetical protein